MTVILIKNAIIVAINKNKDIFYNTDILIKDDKISQISSNIEANADKIIDASGKIILPGFVQTHVHLCQSLFRGLSENRELLYWLRERIWPLEAAHNEESTYYSALLGIGELLSGGTTTILDMGGVNHVEQNFRAIKESGIRAVCGKSMMDCGEGVPENILEKTKTSIDESMALYHKWNGTENNRIQYAFAPRFILSVSDKLFHELNEISNHYKIMVHTHAYENKSEGDEVFKLKGMREFEYFNKIGLLNERFIAAHCVWADENAINLMRENNTKVSHCPSSNFKLGSGTLNIKKLIEKSINVSIGADGSACSNNLDMLQEIRTSALLQNVLNKPGEVEAYKFLEMATIDGAKALGLDKEIGSIEIGKKADLIIMNLNNDFHNWHSQNVDIPTQIVYSAKSSDIETVIIDGEIIIGDGNCRKIDKFNLFENCKLEINKLLLRTQDIKLKIQA